jgi:hypothetical protein
MHLLKNILFTQNRRAGSGSGMCAVVHSTWTVDYASTMHLQQLYASPASCGAVAVTGSQWSVKDDEPGAITCIQTAAPSLEAA